MWGYLRNLCVLRHLSHVHYRPYSSLLHNICFRPSHPLSICYPQQLLSVTNTTIWDLTLLVRCITSRVYTNDQVSNGASPSDVTTLNGSKGNEVEKDSSLSIPVKAYFFSTRIDLRSLAYQNKPNFILSPSRTMEYVVLKFDDLSNINSLDVSLGGTDCSYMVVFQYGSVVLFNVCEDEVNEYLEIVKKHASGLVPEIRNDEYEVREKPSLDLWMKGGLDYIMLQYLDIDGIRIISSVLGQSIALDHYVQQVDGLVAEFDVINREMEANGEFQMKKKKLLQLLGKANGNLNDVIMKLGLFERSDIAWKSAKYAQIWEYLRDEFELTPRFGNLHLKLNIVKDNIQVLKEILQNKRSDFLEMLIVALISVEIIISLYHIFAS